MSDEFELGREDEMEPTSSVTFSTYYVKRASQNRERRAFLFIKHVRFFFFLMTDRFARYDPYYRLVSFIAL